MQKNELAPEAIELSGLELREVRLDHPDAGRLIAEVQAEYVRRYGGPDDAPIDAEQFQAPNGRFTVGYLGPLPVAMGGWRRHEPDHPQTGWAAPAVEIKRMYVSPSARGRGFARALLADLERTAAAAGARWVLLETGSKQPEAITLYQSVGYTDIPAFGHYADMVHSRHFGKQLG